MDQSVKVAQARLHQWAAALPLRSDLHLARKIWHATMGLLVVTIYGSGMPQSQALLLLSSFLIFNLSMELARFRNPAFNEKCVKFFGRIMRTHEVHGVSSVPYFVTAAIFAIGVFPKPVAILSLLYLAVGDPIASLFGVMFKHKSVKLFKNKSLHGSAAAFTACALMTYFYLRTGGLHGLDLIRLTLLGGFAGSFAEALPLELDDNFTIPVISGLILWLGFLVIRFV